MRFSGALSVTAAFILASQAQVLQQPMANPGIQLPPSGDQDPKPPSNGEVILSDIIGTQRQTNIFAGFTRSVASVFARLDDPSQNTTVLAPLNTAISSLPRKPWEDPRDYGALGESAYEGKDGEDRAQRNMRRFTEAHIVKESPWEEGVKVQTMGGGTIWWERKGDKVFVQPGDVEVENFGGSVKNGQVWVLRRVVNYV